MPTTVTGHIAKLDTTTPGVTAFVRFWLRGTRGNEPRITGTGAIAPQFSGSTFYVDLPADASGNISGTIYSTRDSTGTGAGDIEAGGSYTAVYYGMQIVNGGIPGPEIPVHARSGGTLDIANVSPVSNLPVVTAPTGDTTYARLDGGNTPFSGAVSFGAAMNATHGGSLGGAFSGQLNVTNNGVFTNTQANSYDESLLNGINPVSEFNLQQGAGFTTDAMTAGMAVPAGSTVRQANGVGAYVTNASGTATPVVAVYGQARALTTVGGRVWGGNFLAASTVGTVSTNLIGAEVDLNAMNAGDAGEAVLINGTISSVNAQALLIAKPGGSVGAWANGIYLQGGSCSIGLHALLGATPAATGAIGAIILEPVAAGSNQDSQGFSLNATDPGGGSNTVTVIGRASGNLSIATSKAGTGLQVNGNNLTQIIPANVDLTAQTAAITTTTLFAVVTAGQYRLSWNAKVTTAAGTSSTLGALTIVYTDPDGVVQTITCGAQTSAGAIATTSATNTTAAVLLGLPMLLNCKAGTNITYAFAYASNAANAMNYNLHIRLESL